MFDILTSLVPDAIFDAVQDALSDAIGEFREAAGNGVVASLIALLTFGRVTRTRTTDVAELTARRDAGEAVELRNATVKINGQKVAKSGTPLRIARAAVSLVAKNGRSIALVPAGPIGAHPGRGLWADYTIVSFVSAAQDAIWIRVETVAAELLKTELTRTRDRRMADRSRPRAAPTRDCPR